MIDFNFEPQAIDLIKSIDVIKEHGESLSQVSLPSHEDIGSEIQSEEKNIQSLGKEILSANEDIFVPLLMYKKPIPFGPLNLCAEAESISTHKSLTSIGICPTA